MNRREKKLVLALAAAGLMASGYAFGAPHNATTSLDCHEEHTGGTIDQNVNVFPGSSCRLNGVHVTGNIAVWGAGTLRICSSTTSPATTTVDGNVSVTSYIDGVEYVPGRLYVGCEGSGSATLTINPVGGNERGAGNLSCLGSLSVGPAGTVSILGSDRNTPNSLYFDTVNARGNVSVIECDNDRALIDQLNTFTVTGPNGKPQKGNLTCVDNDDPSFANASVAGNTSGDDSCLD